MISYLMMMTTTMTIDTLRRGITFHREIAAAFLKAIQKQPPDECYKPIDLWVCLVLLGANNKQVEPLLRKKINADHLLPVLLERSLANYAPAFEPHTETLLHLAGSFVRQSSERLRTFGQTIFQCCFRYMGDQHTHQSIVRALISHVGGTTAAEVDAALEVLLSLCTSCSAELRSFASFFDTSIVEHLTENQARKAFTVLALLCFDADTGEQLGNTKLVNDVRKLVSLPNAAMQKLGIIGAVAIIQVLTRARAATRHEYEHEHTLSQQLLDAIKDHTTTASPAAFAFFFDEICSLFERAPRREPRAEALANSLYQTYATEFETAFCVPRDLHTGPVALALPRNLLDKEPEIVIALRDHVLDPAKQLRLCAMQSQFRMLRATQPRTGGNYEHKTKVRFLTAAVQMDDMPDPEDIPVRVSECYLLLNANQAVL